jgi:hypothetical protein
MPSRLFAVPDARLPISACVEEPKDVVNVLEARTGLVLPAVTYLYR